jgi:hypothetical protein
LTGRKTDFFGRPKKFLTKMEELHRRIEELETLYERSSAKTQELYKELEEAREKLELEELKDIEEFIPYYTQKLERMKQYIEGFLAEDRRNSVHYAFDKIEHPYKGDFHGVIQDPLDYLIGEYDCLGMTKFLEIVFEYHNESVRKFVQDWMKENVECAEPYGDKKSLYNKAFKGKW